MKKITYLGLSGASLTAGQVGQWCYLENYSSEKIEFYGSKDASQTRITIK
jgi:hypothetical protein